MSVHSSTLLFAMHKSFKKVKKTIMFYCPTLDCSFLAVKELSEYEGGNYKNPKLSFLF